MWVLGGVCSRIALIWGFGFGEISKREREREKFFLVFHLHHVLSTVTFWHPVLLVVSTLVSKTFFPSPLDEKKHVQVMYVHGQKNEIYNPINSNFTI